MQEKLEQILNDLQSVIRSDEAGTLSEEVLVGLKAAWADLEWCKRKIVGNEQSYQSDSRLVAKKPIYIRKCTYLCPPDCGGEEFDEYGYVPHCPGCKAELPEIYRDEYCRKCGQHINWNGADVDMQTLENSEMPDEVVVD